MTDIPPETQKKIDEGIKKNEEADDKLERMTKISEGLFKKIIDNEIPKMIIGERINSAAIVLSLCTAFVSNVPFRNNILINSESSSGKDFIASSILRIFPPNMVEKFSKATPEAFGYYKPEGGTWEGQILYLSDVRENTMNGDTLKVFATEGVKTITVDKGKASVIPIEGIPVMLLTTAEGEPKSEILNRFDIITLDETVDQTKKIMERQSRKAEGLKEEEITPEIKEVLEHLHGDPKEVRITFASKIHKHMTGSQLRLRRDYQRFLNRIMASAALHQLNRERADDGRTILANDEDYENARWVQSAFKYGVMQNMNRKERADWEKIRSSYITDNLANPDFTVKELWLKHPETTDRTWRRRLDKFIQLGLLTISGSRAEPGILKPSVLYQIKENPTGKLNLPQFSNL